MGQETLTLGEAWDVYDHWLRDARVQFEPEPIGMDAVLRKFTASLSNQPASKLVGDYYLLAYAKQRQATLVTFDKALHALAENLGTRL